MMEMMFCKGVECAVRNTCLRYTKGIDQDGKHIEKCTRQKRYVQDKTKVNTDGQRY